MRILNETYTGEEPNSQTLLDWLEKKPSVREEDNGQSMSLNTMNIFGLQLLYRVF